MKTKIGPALARQTITTFWQYNIYVQKPINIGFFFNQFFKICYLIEFFLTTYRPLQKYTKNKKKLKKLKQNTHRLTQISAYKLINIRFLKIHKNLTFFCNFNSRTQMHPTTNKTFDFKFLHNRCKKKLKYYYYTYTLLKKEKYSLYNTSKLKKTNNILKIKKNQIIKKYKFFNKIFNFIKKHQILTNYKKQKSLQQIKKNYIKCLKINKKKKVEIRRLFFKMKTLNRILLKPLKKRIQPPSKIIKYKIKKIYNKKIKKKNNILLFLKILLKNKTKNIKFFNIGQKLLKNLPSLKKNIKLKQKFLKKFINKKPLKKLINIKKKIYTHKIKNISFSNIYHTFWYTNILNKILEFKIQQFLNEIYQIDKIKISLQQEFSFPKATYLLQILNSRTRKNTNFLKHNKKFYNNFINIMPAIQTFYAIQQITQQFAIELARTKKHWRIIRGLELILIQTLIQIKKEPFNNKSAFVGFRITITGRPNKSNRTQKIIIQYGRLTKASFKKYNIFKAFSTSKAQIGSFGITITAAT